LIAGAFSLKRDSRVVLDARFGSQVSFQLTDLSALGHNLIDPGYLGAPDPRTRRN
jgi:hypothetical protein